MLRTRPLAPDPGHDSAKFGTNGPTVAQRIGSKTADVGFCRQQCSTDAMPRPCRSVFASCLRPSGPMPTILWPAEAQNFSRWLVSASAGCSIGSTPQPSMPEAIVLQHAGSCGSHVTFSFVCGGEWAAVRLGISNPNITISPLSSLLSPGRPDDNSPIAPCSFDLPLRETLPSTSYLCQHLLEPLDAHSSLRVVVT